MPDRLRHLRLIDLLALGLRPIRRVASPWSRTARWWSVVCLLGLGLAGVADMGAFTHRIRAAPETGLAILAAALTAGLAGAAAVLSSLPDRDPRWAALPLPALVLWVSASTGGMEPALPGPAQEAALARFATCFGFMSGIAIPVALLLVEVVRRAHPLRPGWTAALIGLAAASASATLLNLFRPYETAPGSLALHALAVASVCIGLSVLCARMLRPDPAR